jgi:hypothetical protein
MDPKWISVCRIPRDTADGIPSPIVLLLFLFFIGRMISKHPEPARLIEWQEAIE